MSDIPIRPAPDIVWREKHSDLCSWCCEPIDRDKEVPFLLWRNNGEEMAQFHNACVKPALGVDFQTYEPEAEGEDLEWFPEPE